MAERRMFSKKIIDTDRFLDMPTSTRLLYYDLCIRADDDGFVSSPKKIARMVGCGDDDLKLLTAKQFIIPFESGVCVIKDWRIHNYVPKDRYHETQYLDEMACLQTEKNGSYTLCIQDRIQPVTSLDTEVRLGKVRLGKDKIIERVPDSSAEEPSPPLIEVVSEQSKAKKKQEPKKTAYGEFKQVKLTDEEYHKLIEKLGARDAEDYITRLDGWLEEGGPKRNKKSHYATILNWWRRDHPEPKQEPTGWEEPKGGKFW